jgi:general stress protein YciG
MTTRIQHAARLLGRKGGQARAANAAPEQCREWSSAGGKATAAKMSKAQRQDRARKGGMAKAARRAAQSAEDAVAQAEHKMEVER